MLECSKYDNSNTPMDCICRCCSNGNCQTCGHIKDAEKAMREAGEEFLPAYRCNPMTGRGVTRCPFSLLVLGGING